MYSNRKLVFFLLLLFGFCHSSDSVLQAQTRKDSSEDSSRPTLLNDVSVLVLTFDPLSDQGISFHHPLAQLLNELMIQGAPQSLANLIHQRGGNWEIIETVRKVQIGLFLPLPVPESEELAKVFLKHIRVGITGLRNAKCPIELSERLMFKMVSTGILGKIPRNSRVTLWFNGPLEQSGIRLKEEIPGIVDAMTFPENVAIDTTLTAPSPTYVCLGIWNKPTAASLASAKFYGEWISREAGAQHQWLYDIWTFPDRIVLTLVATAPLADLFTIKREAESLFPKGETASITEKWGQFQAQWKDGIGAESRTLEKGAFLKAMEGSGDFKFVNQGPLAFTPPDQVEHQVGFPDQKWNRLISLYDSDPKVVTAQVTSGNDRVDVAIGVRWNPVLLTQLKQILETHPLFLNDDIEFSPLFPEFLFIRLSVHYPELPSALSNIRSIIFSGMFQSRLGSPSASPEAGVLPDKPKFIIVVIGDVPSYELYGTIRASWPGEPEKTNPKGTLDVLTLSKALGISLNEKSTPGTNAETLKGRWAIETSTPAGLGRVFAKLLAQGVVLEEMSDVSRTLKLP